MMIFAGGRSSSRTAQVIDLALTILVFPIKNDEFCIKITHGSAIIVAEGQQHIAITGKGTVDGQGLQWWIDMKKPGQMVSMKSSIFCSMKSIIFGQYLD